MPKLTPIVSHASSRRSSKTPRRPKNSIPNLNPRNSQVYEATLVVPGLTSKSKKLRLGGPKTTNLRLTPRISKSPQVAPVPPTLLWATLKPSAGVNKYRKYITSGPGPARRTFRRRISIIEANRVMWEIQQIVETCAARDRLRAEGILPAGSVHETQATALQGEVTVWGTQVGDLGSCLYFITREEAEAAGKVIRAQYKSDFDGLSAEELARMPVLGGGDDIVLEDCLIPRDFKGYWHNAQL